MRLMRTRIFLAAGVMAAAGTVTATVLAAGPASAGSSQVVLVNCSGHGQVRPSRYDLGCMPSNQYISGMSWTSWRSVAFGHATLKVNNCVPSCAQGKYISYPSLSVLWRAASWPKHAGRQYFSRLTLIFTGKRPPGHRQAAQTFTLPAG
ncbi:MAG: hypothetical protein ACLQI7_30305 [Streptosporangiaceae bacterium]